MADLLPLCALGDAAPRSRRFGALTLSENPLLGLASLALPPGVTPPQIGLNLPGPGQWEEVPGRAAFWTGPDQWMIEFPGQADQDVASLLAREAPGCAITEQTDGFAAFDLEGPEAALLAVLEKLVNIDLQGFGPCAATRTGLHHMAVFVIRRRGGLVSFLGMRSAAGSLWAALAEAATRHAAADNTPDHAMTTAPGSAAVSGPVRA